MTFNFLFYQKLNLRFFKIKSKFKVQKTLDWMWNVVKTIVVWKVKIYEKKNKKKIVQQKHKHEWRGTC